MIQKYENVKYFQLLSSGQDFKEGLRTKGQIINFSILLSWFTMLT